MGGLPSSPTAVGEVGASWSAWWKRNRDFNFLKDLGFFQAENAGVNRISILNLCLSRANQRTNSHESSLKARRKEKKVPRPARARSEFLIVWVRLIFFPGSVHIPDSGGLCIQISKNNPRTRRVREIKGNWDSDAAHDQTERFM